jgi:hypothetical protein
VLSLSRLFACKVVDVLSLRLRADIFKVTVHDKIQYLFSQNYTFNIAIGASQCKANQTFAANLVENNTITIIDWLFDGWNNSVSVSTIESRLSLCLCCKCIQIALLHSTDAHKSCTISRFRRKSLLVCDEFVTLTFLHIDLPLKFRHLVSHPRSD